jgi:hypothetical protein
LSSFFGGGTSQAQGDKFPVDNATGGESSPKEDVGTTKEEDSASAPKEEEPERKDSGDTSRDEPEQSQGLNSDEPAVEKGMSYILIR